MVGRYVIVSTDATDLVIKAGPVLWDGVSSLGLPPGQQAITEAAANAANYSLPALSVAQVNASTLEQRAVAALANNSTYLAVTAPTNAQVVAQVARLTRQSSGVIRLLLDQTDDISNT